MAGSTLIFYFVALMLVSFSILAVTTKRLLRAAVYLLFVLVGVSVFYLMMDYMFLAAVQVIVYMGGIVVLIIFSILLTSQLAERMQPEGRVSVIAGVVTCLIGFFVIASVILESSLDVNPERTSSPVDMTTIGESLLSYERGGYVLPFEVISILLLAALIGAVVVARRPKKEIEEND